MGKGVNRVTIIGNAGAAAELNHTGSGTAVATVRLATSESWTDKQSGEKQERTEWHTVKMFGRLGEIAGEYVTKGKQVYIEGSLRTDKYTDKEGVERYSTFIVANEMQLLGGGTDRQGDGGGSPQRGSNDGGQQNSRSSQGRQAGQRQGNQQSHGGGNGNRGGNQGQSQSQSHGPGQGQGQGRYGGNGGYDQRGPQDGDGFGFEGESPF